MYSHDTYGLGHIRRCLAIARSLSKLPSNVLILTGSPLVGRFKIPQRIDFVRIPGMIKVTNEQYLPLSMKLDPAEVLEIRKRIILTTAMAFEPDFFIVDKAPLGLKREVVETLQWFRESSSRCKTILGLRDVMDSSESTIEDWEGKGIYEAMDELYDEIWVYGCRNLYDPIQEYRIPAHIAQKINFTGYIPRFIPSQDDIQATRKAFSIADDEKLILVTTGGGADGHPVVKTFLKAFSNDLGGPPGKTKVIIVTGPFISSRDYQDVVRRCEKLGFITLKFYRFMERLIGAAQVVVSMGGYNTVCEIATQKKPFLIVPRTIPREEQLIRAQVLCSRGYCDYLHPDQLSAKTLRQKVLGLLQDNCQCQLKMEDFPFTALEIIRKRILFQEQQKSARMGARC